MKSDHRVRKIRIQSQSRGQRDGEVGQGAHEEGGEGGDGSGGGDEFLPDFSFACEVRCVGDAEVGEVADACTSRVGEDGRVDGDLERLRWIVVMGGIKKPDNGMKVCDARCMPWRPVNHCVMKFMSNIITFSGGGWKYLPMSSTRPLSRSAFNRSTSSIRI